MANCVCFFKGSQFLFLCTSCLFFRSIQNNWFYLKLFFVKIMSTDREKVKCRHSQILVAIKLVKFNKDKIERSWDEWQLQFNSANLQMIFPLSNFVQTTLLHFAGSLSVYFFFQLINYDFLSVQKRVAYTTKIPQCLNHASFFEKHLIGVLGITLHKCCYGDVMIILFIEFFHKWQIIISFQFCFSSKNSSICHRYTRITVALNLAAWAAIKHLPLFVHLHIRTHSECRVIDLLFVQKERNALIAIENTARIHFK